MAIYLALAPSQANKTSMQDLLTDNNKNLIQENCIFWTPGNSQITL